MVTGKLGTGVSLRVGWKPEPAFSVLAVATGSLGGLPFSELLLSGCGREARVPEAEAQSACHNAWWRNPPKLPDQLSKVLGRVPASCPDYSEINWRVVCVEFKISTLFSRHSLPSDGDVLFCNSLLTRHVSQNTNKVRNILKGQMVTGKLGTGVSLRVGRLNQRSRSLL